MGKKRKKKRRAWLFLMGLLGAVGIAYFANDIRYPVSGIDISHHQGKIDWETLGAGGTDFVFMKATEGQSMVDSRFAENWAAAHEQGIPCAAYHFFLPSVDAQKQAQNFINTVPVQAGDLPPVLDIEVTNNMDKQTLQAGARTWLKAVEAAFGVKPIIYASPSFYNSYLDQSFDEYPLWLAHYYRFTPRLPHRKSAWVFWQNTNMGFVQGVKGNVDRDYFYGTQEELDALRIPG